MRYLEAKGVRIPFIFEKNSDFPVIYLRLVFRNCGRSFDEVAGVASMFARILNEGVNDSFFKDLEFRAINLEASSAFENLELSFSCLSEHKNYAFKALAKLLKNPRFEEKILQRLKLNTLGELASLQNDYDDVAKKLLNQTIFKEKEFQSANEGDETSIKAINLEHLKAFYKNFFHLNNVAVVLGGALEEEEARDLSLTLLKNLEKGRQSSQKRYELKDKTQDVILQKPSEQAYIYFATPFNANFKDEDLHLAKIALFILGQGGFGSRIMEEIRVKRGLAYSAYASLDMSHSYSRVFGYLQTQNENAKEAKEVIKQIFADFVKKGVNEEELKQAKNFILGSTPLRYESLSKRLSIAFAEFYQGLKIGAFKEELAKIKNANLKELNAYIKKHNEILNLSFVSVQDES
ncbi:insulinase family protein [Campylobacter vulpis]|uniref:Insulinase family protein n=1 Tax=Campylobacter vulpis TaxID=1655500 RepID=A0ABS5P0T0_9BACT|nr:pitrilysin family protein [Campylobacter vulpis]MBS4235537.1 insulinase family protein [Campylobacter vulpis]MBS4240302.1 insulinase family protein [Campylobacter vulpis]MBS4252490.1 insulinase family protein [Campylobacter vulpis]MBS4269103.1 insulinase family protein [Campylobacter vulpis]MBS4281259.1 insulinase family protein [Campylobacter vulpis]